MLAFFRDEMVVASDGLTIPPHEKLRRLVALLGDHDGIDLVSDFDPLDWSLWNEVHRESFVQSVAATDNATFDSATAPASEVMVRSVAFGGGSMIAAAMAALNSRCTLSPTSGFHHAHWDRPGPLCLLNALPLTAISVLKQPSVDKVLILDCDYHRGDGTEDILARLDDIRITHESLGFLYSRPQQATEYLHEIDRIAARISSRDFDFVIYQAGMDVLIGDPAGGGLLTLDEARQRDEVIFGACSQTSVPIVWNLAGGYPRDRDDGYNTLLEGHLNTVECAVKAFR